MTTIATGTPTEVEPISADLTETVRDAVALGDEIDALVGDAVAQGLRNVYLIGCGGSNLAFHPLQYLLESRAGFPVFQAQAAELTHRRPLQLGEGSFVVTASHTGTTPETVEATKLARESGATVVAVTKDPQSPLAQAAGRSLNGASVDGKQAVLGQIGWALLRRTGVEADYAGIRAAYEALPEALRATLEESEESMRAIASALKDEPITYVLGAGPNYGAAASLAMCYLQEMQWLDAAAFNAGEFFHGAFEVVTEDTPVILLLGEDATRPMAERAKRFLDTYTKKGVYIDSRDFSLPGIPQELRGELTPAVFYSVIGRLAAYYAALRGHELKTRRYMFKVEY